MSYGYGGRQNPYAQQDSPAGAYGGNQQQNYDPPQQNYGGSQQNYGGSPQQNYPQQSYGGAFGGGGGGYGDNVEMTPLAQNGGPAGSGKPPFEQIKEIKADIAQIEIDIREMTTLQERALNQTDNARTLAELDRLDAKTMNSCRALTQQIRVLKGIVRKGDPAWAQLDSAGRGLEAKMQDYKVLDAAHQRKMREQMARQYRIVRPDADQSEVSAAVEDMATGGGQQVFQQALMQSNRQGQARAVLNEVQNRHQELLKIEQQMTELTQLIMDLDTAIQQQEPMVQQIDEHVEKTQEDLKEANVQLDTAVTTVRSTRKKKWICCGIVTAIILIIVIAVVVYFVVNKPKTATSSGTTAKRSLADILADRSVSDVYAQAEVVARSIAGRIVLPGEFRELNAGRTATLPVALPN